MKAKVCQLKSPVAQAKLVQVTLVVQYKDATLSSRLRINLLAVGRKAEAP